jgi:hypothetical protein
MWSVGISIFPAHQDTLGKSLWTVREAEAIFLIDQYLKHRGFV